MKKKLLVLCMVLALVLSAIPMFGIAESNAYVKMPNAGGSLNLRSGPGTNYSSVGYAQDSDTLDVYGTSGEWSKVTVKRTGKSGYIKTKYIAYGTTTPTTEESAYVYVSENGGSLIVRAGQGTNYAVNGYVQHGMAVTILSKGTTWSKVKVTKTGVTGYIKTKYLRTSGTITPSTDVTSYDIAVITTKYANSTVELRAGAGTSYKSLASLPRGTSLKVTGSSGDWYKATIANGTSGYVYKDYVSFSAKAVTTTGVRLRKGPGTNYDTITTLGKGTSIIVYSITNKWAKVTAGNQSGYVYTQYIQYK